MSVERKQSWDGLLTDSPLDTFQALDGALGSMMQDVVAQVPYKFYFVSTPNANVLDLPNLDALKVAMDRLSERPSALSVSYHQSHVSALTGDRKDVEEGPLHRVQMFLSINDDWEGNTSVSATLVVQGENVDATHGLFDGLHNRLGNEIQRNWLKTSRVATALGANETSRVATAVGANEKSGWWSKVSTHPLYSAIIAGLVVAGVLAAVVAWLN